MISNNEFRAIAELDLDPIKVKLMHKESGEGWTLEYTNSIEFEYRRFLYLMKMFPNEQTAPLFDVDVFWHYHILDTLKYADDCETVFGYFLHHFPYVGLRGEEDEVEHQLAGNRMRELYEATFGDAYIRSGQELATDTRTAWSVKVGKDALALADTRTAWSVKVAQDALPQADTRTAWSVKVAQAALPQADTRTAWSVKVAQAALPQADTRTAWSVKVARDALPQADTRTAWSVKVARDAVPQADTRTAWSVQVARGALRHADEASLLPLVVAASAETLRIQRFYSARPVLVTST